MRCVTRDPRLVGIDLAGTTLVDVDAIGKHLLLRFAKEERVLGHLGQNTTGRRLAQADHWVYARHGRPCPVYG
jgi:formamidopyrimidine-DNA glycosylase